MNTLFFYFLLCLVLPSCNGLTTDEIKSFIPGTYTRYSQHEMGTEHDTLVITPQSREANQYKIVRKWMYERILDGHAQPAEYKQAFTSGIYNPDRRFLQETASGDIISFDPAKELLFVGPTQYQKLK